LWGFGGGEREDKEVVRYKASGYHRVVVVVVVEGV